MYEKSCSLRTKLIFVSITLCIISFAFIHSLMPADISSDESEGVMLFLQNILNFLGINVELNDYIVRKLAHFTEYTAIGVSLSLCAFSFNKKKPYKYTLSILFVALFTAVIDETIQLSTEGRSGQVTDVLLDFSGSVTGIAFTLVIIKIIQYIKIKKGI